MNKKTENLEKKMNSFHDNFDKQDRKRRDALHSVLLSLENIGQKGHVGIFCFHYPWNHPATHFKNSITVMDDGFPRFRLKPLNPECSRLRVLQYRFRLMSDQNKQYTSVTGAALMKYLKERGVSYLNFDASILYDFLRMGFHEDRGAMLYLKWKRYPAYKNRPLAQKKEPTTQ